MRPFKPATIFLVTLLALSTAVPYASAGQKTGDSITITIDRKTMPRSIFHPGVLTTGSETLTVYDYVIRNYRGEPIKGFIVQTASGRTTIPVDSVKEIRLSNWIHRRTDDIELVENVVEAKFELTNGEIHSLLTNADFGTIEGKTESGKFFLDDPLTVRRIVFNRVEKVSEPSKQPEQPKPPKQPEPPKLVVAAPVTPASPLDSDGDGVLDKDDECPDTPAGVTVDEYGCPPDSDEDGVPDYVDECEDTPRGAPVSSVGCWIIKGINFDYKKWDIQSQYYPLLDENIRVLEMNPTFKIEIRGHTDDIGSQAYNQPLSEKRAEATKKYFVSKGVDADRITTRGLGKLSPIVSNATAAGRAQNRRIEIKIISR